MDISEVWTDLPRRADGHRFRKAGPVSSIYEYSQRPPTQIDAFVGVYIARGVDGLTKIGVACDPHARVAQFRGATLLHVLPCEDPLKVERISHARLADHRVRGEWFRCSPGLARDEVAGVIRALA